MNNAVDQLLALKTWAVVGLSDNPDRAAYSVAKKLIDKGHTVIPVHPKAETVHGQKGYATLAEVPVSIDVVDIFVDSDLAGEIVDSAISLKIIPFFIPILFYFLGLNTETTELKKLITTCYQNQQRDFFSNNSSKQAIYLEYEGDINKNNIKEYIIFQKECDSKFYVV